MEPAAPSVERATVLEDTVKRGSIIRQVRGVGTLVPEDTRWLPATTEGRVERILLRPGATVAADSVILVLTNPQVEQEALNARLALQSARAGLDNLRAQLQSDLLTQQAQAAAIQSDFEQARLEAEANEALAKEQLVSELIRKQSQLEADTLKTRVDIEARRLDRRARVDRGAAARAAGHGRSGTGDGRSVRQPAAGAPGHAGVCRGAAAGAGRGRPARGAGPEPGARRRPGTPQGGTAGSRKPKPATSKWASRPKIDTRTGKIAGRVSRKDPGGGERNRHY